MDHFKTFLNSVFCLSCVLTAAQELPPVQNFSPAVYKAENQNWSISQSDDKLIYIANNKGLLEFNGALWKLYPTPDGTIMRSVKAAGDLIYTGHYMDFGFWEKDKYGSLSYTSLTTDTGIELLEDEQFWNIIDLDDWILFQSLDRIYIYNPKANSIEIIESDSQILKMYKVGNRIYFQRLNDGIYKIENGRDVLVTNDNVVKDNVVVNIFSSGEDLLFHTREDGFYLFNGDNLSSWNNSSRELLSTVSVYNSIQLQNKGFVLGTISNGLIYLNDKGDVQYRINKNKGLFNNTVLSLFEDVENNIWSGLDIGVSYINVNSAFKIFKDSSGEVGNVYALAIHDSNIYLGSNQGLFYRSLDSTADFKLIEGTQGQVWCLKEIGETLFCGHNSGTYVIKGNRAELISRHPGTWDIIKLKGKDLLLQGNYEGLFVLEEHNNRWRVRNKIEGFDNSARYFVEMPNNEIFVNHEYRGIFKINVDENYYRVREFSLDSLIKGANSSIIEYNGDLLYAYEEGVYKYDHTLGSFVKDSILSNFYAGESEYTTGKLVLDTKENDLWGFSESNISYISSDGLSNTPTINKIPLSSRYRTALTGFESLLQVDGKNVVLVGIYSGYMAVDITKLDLKKFLITIDQIKIAHRNRDTDYSYIDINSEGEFRTNENTFEISYYVPEYNSYLQTEYQYQLAGFYDEWSSWSPSSVHRFENLPFGDYDFKVRAKIGDRISDNIASYPFSIAKPWYISNLMITIYIAGVLLFSLFMHNVYKRYYGNIQARLVIRNKRELELVLLKKEKEIISIKNEGLMLDYKNKSKELAVSAMSIIRKNELLASIKNDLKNMPNKSVVAPVINIIDKHLKNNDDWEFFEEAFNNADSEFLQNLKALHPNLSPNDLKLCAYLRLNLSSKEIAPLLNISSRSVEIKRYRLRKKMNLSSESNLVSYIIEL